MWYVSCIWKDCSGRSKLTNVHTYTPYKCGKMRTVFKVVVVELRAS